jgi:hypothetical protein
MAINLGSIQYEGLADNLRELEKEANSYGYEQLDNEIIKTCLENHKINCKTMLITDFDYEESDDDFIKLEKIKNYEGMFRFYKNQGWHLFDTINTIYFSLFPKESERCFSNETDCANQAFELKYRGVITSYNCLKGFDT